MLNFPLSLKVDSEKMTEPDFVFPKVFWLVEPTRIVVSMILVSFIVGVNLLVVHCW